MAVLSGCRLTAAPLLAGLVGRNDPSQEPTVEDLYDMFGLVHFSDCIMILSRPERMGIKCDEYGSTANRADIFVVKSGYCTGCLSVPMAELSGQPVPDMPRRCKLAEGFSLPDDEF